MPFYTVVTTQGQAKIANASALGTDINITEMSIGDGGGSQTAPEVEDTGLVNEVYRADVNQLIIDPDNANYMIAELVVPSNVGGWTVREVGLWDEFGDLIAIGNFPDTVKPQLAEGAIRDLVVRMIIEVSDTSAVSLVVDPGIVTATRQWVIDQFGGGSKEVVVDRFVDGVDFTAGATTQLTVSADPGTKNNLWIFFDGVQLDTDDYEVSGTTVTFDAAIPGGTALVEIRQNPIIAIGVPSDNSVSLRKMDQLARGQLTMDQVVATITELPIYSALKTSGYYVPGDGGQGDYIAGAAGSFGTADGGSIIDLPTAGKQLKLITRGMVSVRQFGAVGDGIVDDAAAIQAAIDYTENRTPLGGNLLLPSGTYRVGTSIHQKPRVSLIGEGSRQSIIRWGNVDDTGYEKGVVYCVAGTDGSPDFVFSTNIQGLSISGADVVDVALAMRGHQENCRVQDVVLGGFIDAGLDILPFSSTNHGVTFVDIHIIPPNTASAAIGIRGSDVEKCHFKNITTDTPSPGTYARGVYLYSNPLLNVLEAIHTEDCEYGIYIDTGAQNTLINCEATSLESTGISHFYTTSTRYTVIGMRTRSGFTNHLETPSRTIVAGTDTDSVLIRSGNTYFKRVGDRELFVGTLDASQVTLNGPRITRGVESWAGVDGNGQTYLRINAGIPASGTEYIVIDLGAGAVGFAGKLCAFSTGDQRYATEVLFAGYTDGAGGVSGAQVSAQVTSGSTFLTIAAPEALPVAEVGKIRIPITNDSATFSQTLELSVEITVSGRQAVGISIVE